MANPEHLKILEQGVEVWNKWREENYNIEPDLSSASLWDLRTLDNIRFNHSNLKNVDLMGVSLHYGLFNGADLSGANLSYSLLGGTMFTRTKLSGTNFSCADLSYANFRDINFDQASMDEAILSNTSFIDCNLSFAKNLEKLSHIEFSTIDPRSLAKSGNLPLSFLRGCGLPDEMIDLIPVLQNDPIIFYSCFISYSSKDEEFANRLYADLQDKGIRCWYAPEKMKGGKKLYDQINEAIRMHDKLLLVLSEDSMKSDWVATEIKKARARERHEKRQMLFPIGIVPYEKIKEWELFDADSGIDLAAEVRSYNIPDFSEWKDYDSYRKAFEKLIKDLKGIVK